MLLTSGPFLLFRSFPAGMITRSPRLSNREQQAREKGRATKRSKQPAPIWPRRAPEGTSIKLNSTWSNLIVILSSFKHMQARYITSSNDSFHASFDIECGVNLSHEDCIISFLIQFRFLFFSFFCFFSTFSSSSSGSVSSADSN